MSLSHDQHTSSEGRSASLTIKIVKHFYDTSYREQSYGLFLYFNSRHRGLWNKINTADLNIKVNTAHNTTLLISQNETETNYSDNLFWFHKHIH